MPQQIFKATEVKLSLCLFGQRASVRVQRQWFEALEFSKISFYFIDSSNQCILFYLSILFISMKF